MESNSSQLILSKCKKCGNLFIPPVYTCSGCSHNEFQEAVGSGDGKLLSYTTIRIPPLGFEKEVPYEIGVVRIQEGLNLVARIVMPEKGGAKIGDPVSFLKKEANAYWFKVGKESAKNYN